MLLKENYYTLALFGFWLDENEEQLCPHHNVGSYYAHSSSQVPGGKPDIMMINQSKLIVVDDKDDNQITEEVFKIIKESRIERN